METELISAVSDVAYGPFNLTDVIFIIILLLLLFSSAVISGSEVAYFSLSPGQLEEIRQKGYEKVCHLHRKPEKLLATILISNNFVNVAIVILSSYLVDSLFDFSGNPLLGLCHPCYRRHIHHITIRRDHSQTVCQPLPDKDGDIYGIALNRVELPVSSAFSLIDQFDFDYQ